MSSRSEVAEEMNPIAPWWHTALLLALKGANSLLGAYQHGMPHANLGLGLRISSYVTQLGQEWFAVWLIWLALRSRGLSLGNLVSGRWPTVGAFFKDLGIALGVMVAAIVLTSSLFKFYVYLGVSQPRSYLRQNHSQDRHRACHLVGAGFLWRFLRRGHLPRLFRSTVQGMRPAAALLELFFKASSLGSRTVFTAWLSSSSSCRGGFSEWSRIGANRCAR